MRRFFFRAAKIVVIIAIITALFSMAGCDIGLFSKKDTGEEAVKLKNGASRTFKKIQSHVSEFDGFLKKFNKRWYTTKDVQDFARSLKTYELQISKDLNGLKQVRAKLLALTSIDKDQKYKDFINSTSKASASLKKALFNSQKITAALNAKMGDIANLYSEVDAIKQAQSRYIAAINSWAQRRSLQLTSQAILKKMLAEQENGGNSSSNTSGNESGGEVTIKDNEPQSSKEKLAPTISEQNINDNDVNSMDVKEEKNIQSSTGGDVLSKRTIQDNSTSGSNDEGIDPWVYIIIENKWPSQFVADFAQEMADDFTNIYQRLYEINSTLQFQNSKKLLKYVQEVKTDNADFSSETKAVIDNLKEQRRLGLLIDRYKQGKLGFENSRAYSQYSQQNRPAGVSSGSIANEGATFSSDFARDEINRLDKKINGFQKSLKDLESKYKGSLSTEYEEARWQFYWSLLALYKENRGVSRSLMHEVKGWKRKAISKYTFERMRNLADAKYFRYKANQAYNKATDKIAAK